MRSTSYWLLVTGFWFLCTGVAVAAPTPSVKIPILMYHRIRAYKGTGPMSKLTNVSPQTFRAQMHWLADHGYYTVTLDAMVKLLHGDEPGLAKPMVITFDDGYRSQLEEAVPVLRSLHFTAAFYMITSHIPHPDFMHKKELQALANEGMQIEAHTVHHDDLRTISKQQQIKELAESKAAIEEITGKPVLHFAYPDGGFTHSISARVGSLGYMTAVTINSGFATSKNNLLELPRIWMKEGMDMAKMFP
ncbi:polysaccharide deacetylase family protein [Candidatus Peregrinibacteria bacterium]|nr:polysaccharide deacetylase family protein [Candidatus Peregrinibacteria bacterium]